MKKEQKGSIHRGRLQLVYISAPAGLSPMAGMASASFLCTQPNSAPCRGHLPALLGELLAEAAALGAGDDALVGEVVVRF